jgi:hypothetical protein
MYILNIVLEGICGTLLMTGYVYVLSLLTGKQVKVVRILGTMLSMETSMNGGISMSNKAMVIGTGAHYMVGVLFTTLYNGLWTLGIGRPDLLWCIVFGGASGVFAVIVWSLFFRVHPRPPHVHRQTFLEVIATGHLFFGIGVYLARALFFHHR